MHFTAHLQVRHNQVRQVCSVNPPVLCRQLLLQVLVNLAYLYSNNNSQLTNTSLGLVD